MKTVVCFALFLFGLGPALATPQPRLIPFQARLTDAAGANVPDGVYRITFAIYDVPLGGTALLAPEVHTSVSVIQGQVNVVLGSIQSMDALTFDQPRYLGITVGTGQEMVPRHQLLPSFHSKTADSATQAASASSAAQASFALASANDVPIGAIVPFFGNPTSLPGNWKICNGATLSDPQSPLNGLVLPDLRSKMVRGETDPARNIPLVGANSGGSDTLPTHFHSIANSGAHGHTFTGIAHNHTGATGLIQEGGNNPNNAAYSVEDDNNGWGSTIQHLDVSGGSSTIEGQHRHLISSQTAGGTISNTNTHTHTTDGVSGGSSLPSYVALHFIIRIK